MREPLTDDESPSNLYKMYMALTAEGDLFAADLAESFGPKRLNASGMGFPVPTPCASSRVHQKPSGAYKPTPTERAWSRASRTPAK